VFECVVWCVYVCVCVCVMCVCGVFVMCVCVCVYVCLWCAWCVYRARLRYGQLIGYFHSVSELSR
jgi:hypothetical protein